MNLIPDINSLFGELESLPKGVIGKKTIKGKEYSYHRWYEGGKRMEKYVPQSEVPSLALALVKRRNIEAMLAMLADAHLVASPSTVKGSWKTNVMTGERIRAIAVQAQGLGKRDAYAQLERYLFGPHSGKALALFGLRRTGKTTMMRQALLAMDDEQLAHTALIQIMRETEFDDLRADLARLKEEGYRYIFIDEITLLDNFVEESAFIPIHYAEKGIRIVLSGTDSLSFCIASHEELYGLVELVHTTYIPYREFARLIGDDGIEGYIRLGGTLCPSGKEYNEVSPFTSMYMTHEYVDLAIAQNIQHALKQYQWGGHFRNLYELYVNGLLTGAINRVVQDMNHNFTREVMVRTFKSSDLSLTRRNLERDRNRPNTILSQIDRKAVTDRLKTYLSIIEAHEPDYQIEEVHAYQIKEYLELLELVEDMEILQQPQLQNRTVHTIITQPGLRFAQVEALLKSLGEDEAIKALDGDERDEIFSRIETTVMGMMLEDIVLLEARRATDRKKISVFKAQFNVGEFDMVIADAARQWCRIYEIKYSSRIVEEQYRHLKAEEPCREVENAYGRILSRTVLYRGEDTVVDGIEYRNVEAWLKALDRPSFEP